MWDGEGKHISFKRVAHGLREGNTNCSNNNPFNTSSIFFSSLFMMYSNNQKLPKKQDDAFTFKESRADSVR